MRTQTVHSGQVIWVKEEELIRDRMSQGVLLKPRLLEEETGSGNKLDHVGLHQTRRLLKT